MKIVSIQPSLQPGIKRLNPINGVASVVFQFNPAYSRESSLALARSRIFSQTSFQFNPAYSRESSDGGRLVPVVLFPFQFNPAYSRESSHM